MRIRSALFSFPLLVLNLSTNIFVSPRGNDAANGSKERPVKSFHRAQELARAYPGHADVLFEDGIYYLIKPITMDARDNHCTYRAIHQGKAVISGGCRLDLVWKKRKDGIWKAQYQSSMPKQSAPIKPDMLFINGQAKRMARYPNLRKDRPSPIYGCFDFSEQGSTTAENPLDSARVMSWANPKGAYLHGLHNYQWGDMHWVVSERDGTMLISEGGWQNNRPAPIHPVFRYIENIREELDEPGEWYYDVHDRELLYIPEEGEDMKTALVETPLFSSIINIRGTRESMARDIRLSGFTFRHTRRMFMENKDRLNRSDWTIWRGGALSLENAEDCVIEDCDFDQVGSNAVFCNNYNSDHLFRGLYIFEAGANGVCFVGDTACVRNALFDYNDKGTDCTDFTLGPKSDNYPRHCRVEECLIVHTGRTEKQTAGVQISMSQGITVSHCSIYDMPRAGINISEGCFGGHVIEHCDVFNTVLETGDNGSFNSWGRDRYWNANLDESQANVQAHPGRENLDMLERNVLNHNRWRCDHGFDVDLDDGSSNYLITNNLLLSTGLKLREGYHRKVINNVIVPGTVNLHVWYDRSDDVIMHNIVCQPYKTIGMDWAKHQTPKWGECIDRNFHAYIPNEAEAYLEHGCDSNSVYGAAHFIAPEKGDFRVADDSKALQTGFKNFSMDDFGVQIPRLKAIARVPDFPRPVEPEEKEEPIQSEVQRIEIDGVRYTFVTGQGMSAYGQEFSTKGFAVSVLTKNPLSSHGVKHGDLLIRINGVELVDITTLQLMLKAEIKEIELVRDFKRRVIS